MVLRAEPAGDDLPGAGQCVQPIPHVHMVVVEQQDDPSWSVRDAGQCLPGSGSRHRVRNGASVTAVFQYVDLNRPVLHQQREILPNQPRDGATCSIGDQHVQQHQSDINLLALVQVHRSPGGRRQEQARKQTDYTNSAISLRDLRLMSGTCTPSAG